MSRSSSSSEYDILSNRETPSYYDVSDDADEYRSSLRNRTRRFREHEQHNEPLAAQTTYFRPPARHASPYTPRVRRRSWSQIEAEANADQRPDRSLVPAQRSTNVPYPDPTFPVHAPTASNPIRRFPAIDRPVHVAQPGYSSPQWPTQQSERRMQVTPPRDKVQHTEHPQYAQERGPEGLHRNDQVKPEAWQKNEDQHSCPLGPHPIPADLSPETQGSEPSIRRVDLVHDPSRATNDLTVQLEMELEEDWDTDLDEFCRLYRLGRFKEAKEYYRLNLTHVDSVPYVRVHYAEMLISCGDYQTFQALERLPEFDAGGLGHKPEERDRGKLAANFELLALLSQTYTYKYIETAWKVVRNTLKALQHEKVMGSTEVSISLGYSSQTVS
ncbi:hypothetical protein QBC43DRAFT_1387 [Cladorrhinum sp. PSN259]|nr:hypothetical protein QBC43DRAFT_1387 [Cladorrhinum sp. PSN259]